MVTFGVLLPNGCVISYRPQSLTQCKHTCDWQKVSILEVSQKKSLLKVDWNIFNKTHTENCLVLIF